MGRVKLWIYSGSCAYLGAPSRFALSLFFTLAAACSLLPAMAHAQTELGSEDDLTILGTNGTALDPDTEIKGFSVFGSTQAAYSGAAIGPGNVVVNGALAVSSGAYFVGNSTFTNAGKIFINDGAAGQMLRRNAAGYLEWANSSALGDNLGNHIATTTLQMGSYGINSSSTINAGYYQINGSTVIAVLPGAGSFGIGPGAGAVNTAANNLFVGHYAGQTNTTGSLNTFVGYGAGNTNTGQSENAFFGYLAGQVNNGQQNSFMGAYAGQANSTGGSNTFAGYKAGIGNNVGYNNSFIGWGAGLANTGGDENVYIGYHAGGASSGGNQNVLIGAMTGNNIASGSGNIVIGYDLEPSGSGVSNELNIGALVYGNLTANTVGINQNTQQAALDVVSTGTASNIYAQIWRDGSGNVVSSMTSTGVLYPAVPATDNTKVAKTGDTMTGQLTISGSSLTVGGNISVSTVVASGDITAARYQINGSTVLALLPGTGSLGVGVGAGRINSTNNNSYIGYQAGYAAAAGTDNAFLGYQAGYNNAAIDNTAVGSQAGYTNAAGTDNSFFGMRSGYLTTAGKNSFFGSLSGRMNDTGLNNTFIGYSAGYNNTTGANNIFEGALSGFFNQTGSANAILGNEAGGYDAWNGGVMTSFSSSTLLGYRAGYKLETGGNDNILIGFRAGDTIDYGTRNLIIGYDQDASAANASNELNIGGVLFGNLSAKTVGISTRAPQAALDVVSTGTAHTEMAQIWRDGGGVIVGSMSATGVLQAVKFIGDGSALTGITGTGDNLGNHIATTTLQMGAYGVNTSSNITAARYQINGSTVLALLPGSNSMTVGLEAGLNNSGNYNVFLGYRAGYANLGGGYNTFLGYMSGLNNTTGGYNAFIGGGAGQGNVSGSDNTFLGVESGSANSGGSGNVMIGHAVGAYNDTGRYNSVLGTEAVYYMKGTNNTVMGYRAGYGGSTGAIAYSSSTIIGSQAGYSMKTGAADNILLGYRAGYAIETGVGNIVIGYNTNTSGIAASNELNIGGVLFGKIDAKTIGISTRAPQAALDIVSTGTLVSQYAQIWRDSTGLVVASMTATGKLWTAVPPSGDNLGSHTATQDLDLAGNSVLNVDSMSVVGQAGYVGAILTISTGTSTMVEIKGTGEIVASKFTVQSGVAAKISTDEGDISIEPAGGNVNVLGNLNVTGGSNVGLEGASGDTYMKYNSGYISMYVNGLEVARFKP